MQMAVHSELCMSLSLAGRVPEVIDTYLFILGPAYVHFYSSSNSHVLTHCDSREINGGWECHNNYEANAMDNLQASVTAPAPLLNLILIAAVLLNDLGAACMRPPLCFLMSQRPQ